MTLPDHLRHQSHLSLVVHLQSEIACTSSDSKQMFRRHDDLAQRYDDAMQRSAVDDACRSAADIASEYSVYDVGRQVCAVHQEGWLSLDQAHVVTPSKEARVDCGTTLQRFPLDFSRSRKKSACAAPQSSDVRSAT